MIRRIVSFILFVALARLVVFAPAAMAQRPTPENSQRLNLLALGDWGGDTPQQKQVADEMASLAVGKERPVEAALLLGDNFYMDLPKGTKSQEWQTVFEEVYDLKRMPFPFYAVLGNHDYEKPGKSQAELDYAREHPESRWKIPARWYRLDLPEKQPLVTLLMLDSNWHAMLAQQWDDEMHWLETELSKPRESTWLLCAAHFPLFNNGLHGDDNRLKKDWGPLFKRANVDFYLCGHDHDLQHLEIADWPTSFVISGGGGKSIYPILRSDRGPFAASSFGCVALSFTPRLATVTYYDAKGNTLHQFERTAEGKVTTTDRGRESVPALKP